MAIIYYLENNISNVKLLYVLGLFCYCLKDVDWQHMNALYPDVQLSHAYRSTTNNYLITTTAPTHVCSSCSTPALGLSPKCWVLNPLEAQRFGF